MRLECATPKSIELKMFCSHCGADVKFAIDVDRIHETLTDLTIMVDTRCEMCEKIASEYDDYWDSIN